jgi:NAD(P)H-dependent FMN reductase
MSLRIAVIVGSTRPERAGLTVGKWAFTQLPKQEGVTYDLIDLATVDLPFLNEIKIPAQGEYDKEHTIEWGKKIASYDGYIFVISEYNHGYAASLKNAVDTIYHEWAKKPVAFIGYGALGAARSIEQMATVVANCHMVPLTATTVNVIDIWAAVDADGSIKPEFVRGDIGKTTENLLWWANALQTARS